MIHLRLLSAVAGLMASVVLVGCSKREQEGILPKDVADAVHMVIEADRTIYAQKVVNRLQDELKIIKASEHWEDDKALPLPAQMFRMGSELAQQKNAKIRYALLSLWPINNKNAPRTDVEKNGLKAVAENKSQNFYEQEQLGDRRFFTAVYPDIAVSPACIDCHNNHKDSPRKDFKVGDVMGGIVVRIALE